MRTFTSTVAFVALLTGTLTAGSVSLERSCMNENLQLPGTWGYKACNPMVDAVGQKGENLYGRLDANSTDPIEKGTVLEITVNGMEPSKNEWRFSANADDFSVSSGGEAVSGFDGNYVFASGGYKARIYVEKNVTSPVDFRFETPYFSGKGSVSAKACLVKDGTELYCSDDVPLFGDLEPKNYDGRGDYVFPADGSLDTSDSVKIWLRVEGGGGEKTAVITFPPYVEIKDAAALGGYDFTDGRVGIGWNSEDGFYARYEVSANISANTVTVTMKGSDDESYESHVMVNIPIRNIVFKDAPLGENVEMEVSGDIFNPFSVSIGEITPFDTPIKSETVEFLVNGDSPELQTVGSVEIVGDYPGKLKPGGYFTMRLPRGYSFPSSGIVSGTMDGIEFVKRYGDTNDRALFKVTGELSTLKGDIMAYAGPYAEIGEGRLVIKDGYEEDPSYPSANVSPKGDFTASLLWLYKNGKEKAAKVIGTDKTKLESGKENNLTVFCETSYVARVSSVLRTLDGKKMSIVDSNASEGRFTFSVPPLSAGEELEGKCFFDAFKSGKPFPSEIITESEPPVKIKVIDDEPLVLKAGDKSYGEGTHVMEMEDDDNVTFEILGVSGELKISVSVEGIVKTEVNGTSLVFSPIKPGNTIVTVADVNDAIDLNVTVVPSMIQKSVTLYPGWNMITPPGPVDVNSSVVSQYTGWKLAAYSPEDGSWKWTSSMRPFVGYWMYVDAEEGKKEFRFSYPRRKEIGESAVLDALSAKFVKGKWNLMGVPIPLSSKKIKSALGAKVIWRYENGKWYRNPETIPAGGAFYAR